MAYEKILSKLGEIEKKQDKIISLLTSKPNPASKLEAAEIFFENCRLDKVPMSKAPDLIYPSIYSTREHAINAIKTLQKKGLLIIQGNFLELNKKARR